MMPQTVVMVTDGEAPVNFEYRDDTTQQTIFILVTMSGLGEAYSNHHSIMQDMAEAMIPAINASNTINYGSGDFYLVSITKLATNEAIALT
jgi:ribosome biogenesis protein Tsr3